MKGIIEEIRMHFASQTQGIRQLNTIGNEYKAYSFRQGVEYGLAIPTESEKDIYEDAAQITIKSFNNMGVRYIALSCCDEEFRNEFARFGVFFILPGDNGETRKSILTSPLKWWEGWIGMLGNRIGGRQTYDTIAEMLSLDYLYKNDKTTIWTAKEAGTHDIESSTNSYEVKSSIKKSETTITISSQHQLSSANPLYLIFFRMEKSLSGYSINDVARSLIAHGYDKNILESQLESKGFHRGSSIRDVKYTILETRKFEVTDKFPKIVEKSFKNDVFPKNIIKILYTIDLEGLDYVSMIFVKNADGTIERVLDEKTDHTISEDNVIDNIVIYQEMKPNCIPLFTLRAACGYFDDCEFPEEEGWIDASGHGFTPDPKRHFVVHAKGDSMLPKIKDGDLCVFEWYKAGSRNGEIVLTQSSEFDSEYGGKYTIKKYHSEKTVSEDGWKNNKVELLPLNLEFNKIELDEDGEYRTIGIFKCVL